MKYIFIAVFVYLVACLTTVTEQCLSYARITQIGGCDRYAECMVKLSDGSRKKIIYPLVDDVVCVNRVSDIRWLGFE